MVIRLRHVLTSHYCKICIISLVCSALLLQYATVKKFDCFWSFMS